MKGKKFNDWKIKNKTNYIQHKYCITCGCCVAAFAK